MRIDRSEFGNITIDGKTYDHDVMIGLSGRVRKRKKKLEAAVWNIARRVQGGGESRLREGMRCDHHRQRPGRQRPPVPGGGGLFREEGVRSAVAANAESDQFVQPIGEAQDRADACLMLSAISESIEAELRRTFEQIIPFNRMLGLRIDSLGFKAPRLRFDMRPELVGNPVRQILHGGVISATLDVVAA